VTVASAGALLVLVATVTLAVFKPGTRPGSGAADPGSGQRGRPGTVMVT
jgi:hypothetical protein